MQKTCYLNFAVHPPPPPPLEAKGVKKPASDKGK